MKQRLPWLLLAAVLVAGCASPPTVGVGVGPSLAPEEAREAPVRPGDQVALRIWSQPAMSDTFDIAETGELILPRLDPVQTSGMSAGALQDSLRRAYAEFLHEPAVRVIVLRRVGVLGEVRQPGVYLVDLTTTAADVIAMAGGLTPDADRGRVVIQRGGSLIRLSQSDQVGYLQAGLLSGDQIVVQTRGYWARNPTVAVSMLLSLTAILLPYVTR